MTTRDLIPPPPSSSSSHYGGAGAGGVVVGRRRILVLADHLGRHLSDMLTYVIRRKAEVMVIFKPYAPMAAVTQDIDALTRGLSRCDAVVVIAGTNDLQLNSSDQIVPLVESMLRRVLHRTRLIVATIPKRYDSTAYKKTISQTNKGIRSLRNRYPALKILELEDMGRAYHCSRGFSLNTKGKLKLCVKLSELVAVTPKTKFLNAPFDRIAMFLDPFEPAEEDPLPLQTKKETFPVKRVVVESDIKFMTPEGHEDQTGDDVRGMFGRVIGEVILRQGPDNRDCNLPVALNVVKSKVNFADESVVKRQNLAVSKSERLTCTSRIANRENTVKDHQHATTTQTKIHSDEDKVLQLVFTISDGDLALGSSKSPAVIDIVLDLKRILRFCDEKKVDCTLLFSDVRMSYDSVKGDVNVSLKMSVTVLSPSSGGGDHLRLDLKPTTEKFSVVDMQYSGSGDQLNKSLPRGENSNYEDDDDDRDFFDLSIMNWNELLDISDNETFSAAEISESISKSEINGSVSTAKSNKSLSTAAIIESLLPAAIDESSTSAVTNESFPTAATNEPFSPAEINQTFSSPEIKQFLLASEINEGSILTSRDGRKLDLQGLLKDSSRYYSRSHTDWNLLFSYDYIKSNHVLLPCLYAGDAVADPYLPEGANSVFSPPNRKKPYSHQGNYLWKAKKVGNFRADGARKQRCDRLPSSWSSSASRYSLTSNLNALFTRLLKGHHFWASGLSNKKFCGVSEECNWSFIRKYQRYGNSSTFGETRKIRKFEGDSLRNRQFCKKYDLSLVKEAFCSGNLDYLRTRNCVAAAGPPCYLRDVHSSNQRLIDSTLWEMVKFFSRCSRQYPGSVGRGFLPNSTTKKKNNNNMWGRESGSVWYGPDRRSFEAECRSRGVIQDHLKEVTATARNSRARNYIVRIVKKLLSKLVQLTWNFDSE